VSPERPVAPLEMEYGRVYTTSPGTRSHHRHYYHRQENGRPRRIEIWFHNVAGRLYITGTPGRRDWYANMLAHPEFLFHLKQSVRADLPARATAVLDKAQRREIMATIHQKLSGKRDLETWTEASPLVAVKLLVE
jgi:hypothetical protein